MRYALILGLILCLFLNISFAIDLTTCSNISYAGSYNLLNSVSNVSAECFTIRASNVELNCNSFNVSSQPNFAIRLGTTSLCYSNVSIMNCNLTGYGGYAISNGYTYGGGCTCGYTTGDYFTNNSIYAITQGLSYQCVLGMQAYNNSIDLTGSSSIGIYEGFSGSQYYDNITINTPLGVGFKSKYSSGTIINNSRIMSETNTAIYNEEHGGEIIDYSIINASNGGYTYNGGGVVIRHSSIYVNNSGFSASWSDLAYVYDSQIIGSETAIPVKCDNVAYWPYYKFLIIGSNITAYNNTAIKNGNAVYSIGCDLMLDNSSVFSQYGHAIEEYDDGYYENSIITTNGTDKSAVISSSVIRNSTFDNITLIVNGGGYALQDLAHNRAVYRNITFNGTVATISNTSNNMNFTAGYLPFVYTTDAGVHLNISSPAPYYAHIQLYYTNETNESQYYMVGWDGTLITNVSDSDLNTTLNYVNGTVSWAGIFFIVAANGTAVNYTAYGTCEYWGNCTVGSACTQDSDCASGICFEGTCISSGGCVGDACGTIPDIVEVINIFLGSASMIGFLIALILLAAGAGLGFKFAGVIGAIIFDIIILIILSILPVALVPWWMTVVCLLAAGVSAIYLATNRSV